MVGECVHASVFIFAFNMNLSTDARRVKTDLITFANIYIRKSEGKNNKYEYFILIEML